MEIIMDKVTTLSDKQYNRIVKGGRLGSDIRELLDILKTKKVNIGDTVCTVGQPSNTKDVFKYTWNNRNIFYVVINPMGDKMAMCYSIY
jgi:hypothetical protein|nr:MAG TPA: hypothetical protein [Caudoviricetes sp.]